MIVYRDTDTYELFTKGELEDIYYEQILAVEEVSLLEENTFVAWLREMVAWGRYLIEENEDAR